MRLSDLRGLSRVVGPRRPVRNDVVALVSAAAVLVCAAPALGPWGTVFCALGVLIPAFSAWTWPATVVAVGVVAAVAVDGQRLLLVGLLTTTYLLLLSGLPRLDGLAAIAVGVGVAILVTASVLAVAVPASIWWVLPTAAAVPVLLAVVAGPRPLAGRRRKGPE